MNSVKVIFLLILIETFILEIRNSSVVSMSKQPLSTKCPTNCSFGIQYSIDHNFMARYTFGNRRNSGIKMCHWNGGSSYLINKMNEIEAVVSNYKPHIFGLSENCYSIDHSVDLTKIDDYEVYFAKTLENPSLNVSRVSVYVHNDLQSKLRPDLMSDKFSSIWVEVGHRNQRKILVCNLYREWKYLNSTDTGHYFT